MLSFDKARQYCYDQIGTGSSNTSAVTYFDTLMNFSYKWLLARFDRTEIEKTATTPTVASRQYYQVPPDFKRLMSAKVTVGSIDYPLTEVQSQDEWDRFNTITTYTSDIPSHYFVRARFGLGGSEVGIFPTPTSASNTITFVYKATERDLGIAKYTTGTVTLTNGSQTVTGSGTTFTNAMVGRYLTSTDAGADGLIYRISSYASATSISLEQYYAGSTVAGATYEIFQVFNLPEDMQMLPAYFALAEYYRGKGNTNLSDYYKGLFDSGYADAKKFYGARTSNQLINLNSQNTLVGDFYPGNWPAPTS